MIKKKIIFSLFIIFVWVSFGKAEPASGTTSSANVKVVGAYSNVKLTHNSEDPHSEGYRIELYQEGSRLFGLFFSYQGLDGDTPRGRLEEIRYDVLSGKLAFKAKLTTGQEFSSEAGPEGRPSRDLFEFAGSMKATEIQGSLIHRDGYHLERTGKIEKLILKKDPAASKRMHELLPKNYQAWSQEPLLFGPQW